MKRIISLLLALTMIASMVTPAFAAAGEGTPAAAPTYYYEKLDKAPMKKSATANVFKDPTENGDGPAALAFDGDSATGWHSPYEKGDPNNCNYWIEWDLTEGGTVPVLVGRLDYRLKEGQVNGKWKTIEILATVNGAEQSVFKGDITIAATGKATVVFPNGPVNATHMKVLITASIGDHQGTVSNDNMFAAAGEIDVYKATTEMPDYVQVESQIMHDSAVDNSHHTPSENETEGPVSFAFDGNMATMWHSRYGNGEGEQGLPYTIKWNAVAHPETDDPVVLSQLDYFGRDNNGAWREVEIYATVSAQGKEAPDAEWTKICKDAVLEAGAVNWTKTFEKLVAATAVKIVVISGHNGFACAKEIELYRATDAQLVDAVNKIAKLPAADAITLDHAEQVKAARAAFAAVADEKQALIDTAKLTAAEAKLETLKPAKDPAVENVRNLIDLLPEEITLANADDVAAARAAYDVLNEQQKAQINNIDKLTAAEAKLDDLKAQAEVDKAAAKAVADKIEALPAVENVKWANKAEIDAANAAFTALTDAQKALVPEAMRTKLTAVVAKLAEVAPRNLAREEGVVVTAKKTEGDTPADFVNPDRHAGMAVDGIKNNCDANHLGFGQDNNRYSSYAQVDLGKMCDITSINLYRYWNGNRTYDATVIAVSETADFAEKVILYNSDKANVHKLGTGTEELYQETNKGKTIDGKNTRARYVRVYMYGVKDSGTTNHIVELEVMGFKSADQIPAADRKAAAAVVDEINALHDPITLADKDAVAAANTHYEALNETAKTLVTAEAKAKLTAAVAKIAELEQAEADKAAAAAVEAKITALGEITLESEADIKAAREAYTGLSDAQKALVKNLSVLEAAEAKLAELKAPVRFYPFAPKGAGGGLFVGKSYIGAGSYIGWQKQAAGLELKAQPAENFHFVKWIAADQLNGKSTVVSTEPVLVLDRSHNNKVLTPVFEEDLIKFYPFAPKGAGGGMFVGKSYIGAGSYIGWQKNVSGVTLKAQPAEGYEFVQWIAADELNGEGIVVSTEPVLVLAHSHNNKVLTPVFQKTQVQIVIDKINAIGEVTYTPECKAKIDDAQKAYMALTREQQKQVTNIRVWEQANAKYHELELAHQEELAKVRPLAQRVIDLGEITLADKAEIESIRADYNALKPFAQEHFQNYGGHNYLTDLEAAEAKLASLEKAEADKAAAQKVIDKINAIGEVTYTPECEAKIKDAQKAYMALTREQQKQVTNIRVWEQANAKYHELELAHQEELAKVRPLAQRVIDLGEITLADKAEIESIRAAYNALKPFAQEYFQNYYGHNYLTDLEADEAKLAALEKAEADKAAAKAVEDKINAIGEVTYTPECEAKIKDAQKAYNALTKEQQALVTNLNVWEQANAKYHELDRAHREELAKVRPLVQRVIDLGEITLADKAEIENIRAAYNALEPFAQEYFQNYYGHNYLTDLEADEAKLAALEKAEADKAAAKAVEDKINAIGEVTYTPECEAKIKDAQKAYNALTKEQQALVTNINVWEQANAKYHELDRAHREELAKVRPLAQRVIDLGEITLADKAEIESIRAAYNALQPFAQEYFQNYYGHNYLTDLEAAEAKLAALEDANITWGVSLSLEGNISVNFYATSGFTENVIKNGQVKISVPGEKVQVIRISEQQKDPNGTYRFSAGVSARRMTDKISIEVVVGDKTVSAISNFSIRKYAEVLLEADYPESAKNLVRNMLYYGAEMQNFAKHNEQDLATSILPEQVVEQLRKSAASITKEQLSQYAAVKTGSMSDLKLHGTNLTLLDETTLRFYFTPAQGKTAEDYTFTVDGKPCKVVKIDEFLCVEIENITAQRLAVPYEVKAASDAGSMTIRYSPMSYVYTAVKQDLPAAGVGRAMVLYNAAAVEYWKTEAAL